MRDGWALILGVSSSFGAATAVELARNGLDIFGVHLDRRQTLPNVERVKRQIEASGQRAVFFNVNAADHQKREQVLDCIQEELGRDPGAQVRVLLHSLAFGSTARFVPENPAEAVTPRQMEMTLDVMASSLVYWVQGLIYRGLMGPGGRIFAMTSAGASRVIPHYGPVSAAKAALESNIRQLAFELAPRGITANAICAGVTDTPALHKIPGGDKLLEAGRKRNPSGRTTSPEDVAAMIAVLSDPRTQWSTGNVIRVDGGEGLTI